MQSVAPGVGRNEAIFAGSRLVSFLRGRDRRSAMPRDFLRQRRCCCDPGCGAPPTPGGRAGMDRQAASFLRILEPGPGHLLLM